MSLPEQYLIWYLRFTAVMLLCAAPAVVMPSAWMRAIAEGLGLDLPAAPLVEYLTRSVSALYAFLGALCWFLSRDLKRYMPLVRFTIPCAVVFDAGLVALDVWIPMPAMWVIGEAASILTWTAGLWWLSFRVDVSSQSNDGKQFTS